MGERLRPRVAPVRRSGNAMRRTCALLAPMLMIGACVPSGHLARERAPSPTFDPIVFFAGHTRGVGSLKVLTKKRQTVLVEGHGVVQPDGTIVLTQDVRRGNRPVVHRTWHLRTVAPGGYAGTLSDAMGPVAGDAVGNTLHLAFRMKGGLHAQQWLELQPGGQVAHNRLVVSKLGVPVASLDETITRIPR